VSAPERSASGLRERKRADTRRRIEHAAVDVLLRDGLDGVTIEAIAAEADVAPRTFFNYFSSKEAAILGTSNPVSCATDPDEEHGSGDIVIHLVRLIVQAYGPNVLRRDLRQARRHILRTFPEIGEAAFRARIDLQRSLAAAARQDTAMSDAASTLLASTCMAAVKIAYQETDDALEPEALEDAAVALLRDLAPKLY
jgi:AcrR family transcriptional regulator